MEMCPANSLVVAVATHGVCQLWLPWWPVQESELKKLQCSIGCDVATTVAVEMCCKLNTKA